MRTSKLISFIIIIALLSIEGCISPKEEYKLQVVLEITGEDVIKSLAVPHYLSDPLFLEVIALAGEKESQSTSEFIHLFAESFEELNPGGQLAQFFMTLELRDEINFNTTNDEVVAVLMLKVEDGIRKSYSVLETRLDNFGVSEKKRDFAIVDEKIQITMKLKSDKTEIYNSERIAKILSYQANLQFWATYENTDIWTMVDEANRAIAEIPNVSEFLDSEPVIPGGSDTTDLSTYSDMQFLRENPLFAVMSPYADNEGHLIPSAIIGVVGLKDTAKVNKFLSLPQVKLLFPGNLIFAWHFKTIGDEQPYIYLYALKALRNGQPEMDGKYVVDASADNGGGELNLSMNAEGAKRWARITRENVQKPIAIVINDAVYSAPIVMEEIKGGNCTITGDFTQEYATDLANFLKSDFLPYKLNIVKVEIKDSAEPLIP